MCRVSIRKITKHYDEDWKDISEGQRVLMDRTLRAIKMSALPRGTDRWQADSKTWIEKQMVKNSQDTAKSKVGGLILLDVKT